MSVKVISQSFKPEVGRPRTHLLIRSHVWWHMPTTNSNKTNIWHDPRLALVCRPWQRPGANILQGEGYLCDGRCAFTPCLTSFAGCTGFLSATWNVLQNKTWGKGGTQGFVLARQVVLMNSACTFGTSSRARWIQSRVVRRYKDFCVCQNRLIDDEKLRMWCSCKNNTLNIFFDFCLSLSLFAQSQT